MAPWTRVHLCAGTKPQRQQERCQRHFGSWKVNEWHQQRGKSWNLAWRGNFTWGKWEKAWGGCRCCCRWRVGWWPGDSLYHEEQSFHFPSPSSLCRDTNPRCHWLKMTGGAVTTWEISSPFPCIWRWDTREQATPFKSFQLFVLALMRGKSLCLNEMRIWPSLDIFSSL